MKKILLLPYRTRLKWMAWIIPLILFACYQLSFRHTITEYKLYRRSVHTTEQGIPATGTRTNMLGKNRRLDSLLGKYTLDTVSQEKNLLKIVAAFCTDHAATLTEYSPVTVSMADSTQIATRTVTIQGTFAACLQLVYLLETRYQAGRVSSVLYKTVKQGINKPSTLLCTLYIQNITG